MQDSHHPAGQTALSFSLLALLFCVIIGLPQNGSAVDLGDLQVPASRIPTWRAGVQGDLPDTSNGVAWPVHSTLMPGAGVAALQAAIDSASSAPFSPPQQGWVVQMPAGTSTWGLEESILMRSNVVVRGAGIGKTKIMAWYQGRGTYSSVFFFLGSLSSGEVAVQSSSLPAGTTVLDLDSSNPNFSELSAGDWMLLSNKSDLDFPDRITSLEGNPSMNLIAKIVNVQGAKITLDRELPVDLTDGLRSGMVVRELFPVRNAGVEDLSVEGVLNIPNRRSGHFHFWYAVNSWIRRVSSDWHMNFGAVIFYSSNITITSSRLGPSKHVVCDQPGIYQPPLPSWCPASKQSDNYAVQCDKGAQDSLIVNNVFYKHPTNLVARGGPHGNVFAYNYIKDPVSGGVDFHGILMHGQWAYENLVEGNDSRSNMTWGDAYWGRQGPRNTFYRNRFRQHTSELGGHIRTHTYGLDKVAGQMPNLIGNIAYAFHRMPFCHYEEDGNCGDIDEGAVSAWIGYNIATDQRTSTCGDGTGEHCGMVLWPNSDTQCGGSCSEQNIEANRAPPTWDSLKVPDSLFFASREDWQRKSGAPWCSEACPWQAQDGIGAFGDDVSSALCKLPAQIQYEGGSCTPSSVATGTPPADPPLWE